MIGQMDAIAANEYLDTNPEYTEFSTSGFNEDIHIISKLMPYLNICICILGLPGNLLIIKVMKRSPLNEMSHSIICMALAVADLYYLIYLLIISSLELILGFEVIFIKMCKIYFPCIYLAYHLDAWFIVFLTYERVIAVAWPLNAGQIITKKRVIIIVISLVIFFVLWDSINIFRYDVFEMKFGNISFEMCDGVNSFGMPEKFFNIHDVLSEQLGTLIPIAFIFIGNTGIMYKLYAQKRIRAQLGQGEGNELAKTNVMIITVTTAFVLLMAPSAIYRIVEKHDEEVFDPVLGALYILTTLNPAINCYLYFITGKIFRKQLKKLLSKMICFKPTQMDHSITNISTLSTLS